MVKNLPASEGDKKRHGFNPWVKKIPWRRKWQHTPVFLPARTPWTEEPGRLQSVGLQESDKTDRLTTTTAEFQKETDVILEYSIYVPVNTDVCSEQDAIPGCAKEIKYIICNPSLKNFRKMCLQTDQ